MNERVYFPPKRRDRKRGFSLPCDGHHKSTVHCLSHPRLLANISAHLSLRRRNIRKPPRSRISQRVRGSIEERRGRIRLIFQLGIETTNRRSRRRVTVRCLREDGDRCSPSLRDIEGRKALTVRLFLPLSFSKGRRARGIFFCQMLESKRGAVGDVSRGDSGRDGVDSVPPFPSTVANGTNGSSMIHHCGINQVFHSTILHPPHPCHPSLLISLTAARGLRTC